MLDMATVVAKLLHIDTHFDYINSFITLSQTRNIRLLYGCQTTTTERQTMISTYIYEKTMYKNKV